MNTINNFKRRVDHLPEDAIACLQKVEDLFGASWLKEDGNHLLQILWLRRDPLSTNELYVLGNAIKKLQPTHKDWLASIAEDIKRDAATANGFIFEIIVCGAIEGTNGAKLKPSPKNKPGVDLTLRFPDGFQYEISVKNHGISKHETEFQSRSKSLDEIFQAGLKAAGKNGRLFVSCEDHMTEEDFQRCTEVLQNTRLSTGKYDVDGSRLGMIFREFSNEPGKTFSRNFTSHLCIVSSPQHRNDRLNFRDKLSIASGNMRKHLTRTPKNFLLLRMRLHANADIIGLKNLAQEMIDHDENCGFDGVILTQATVVKGDGRTAIHTVFQAAMNGQRDSLIQAGMAGNRLNVGLGLGTIGQTPTHVQLDVGNGKPMRMDPSNYFYQRGDFYYLMKEESGVFTGEMESPASGIHTHCVWKNAGGEVLMKGISPPTEELLLI